MVTYKHGDVFSLQLPGGKYVAGRVILDVHKQCVRRKKITDESSLSFFDGTVLVDLYMHVADEPASDLAERLIAGVFVMDNLLKSGQWPVIGYVEVDPRIVEFPETLANVQGRMCFQRGEVVLPFAAHAPLLDSLMVYPTMHRADKLPMVCNFYLQQAGVIQHVNDDQARDLKYADLRYNEHRSEIYALLGEDESQSYYQMSSRFGHDIARFY